MTAITTDGSGIWYIADITMMLMVGLGFALSTGIYFYFAGTQIEEVLLGVLWKDKID